MTTVDVQPTSLPRTTDPASLQEGTVLVHPEHDPRDRDATRVLLTTRPLCPWVPISGRAITHLHPLAHNGVWGWQIQPFPDVVAALTRKAR